MLLTILVTARLFCGGAVPPPTSVYADTTPIVVDTIPPRGFIISKDSLEALYAPDRIVYSHRRMSGRYPKALLLVGFQRSASVAQRRRAIELSEGRLIGGEGVFYWILVEDDGTADPLWRAIDRVSVLPYVTYAGPEVLSLNITTGIVTEPVRPGAPRAPAGAAPPPRP